MRLAEEKKKSLLGIKFFLKLTYDIKYILKKTNTYVKTADGKFFFFFFFLNLLGGFMVQQWSFLLYNNMLILILGVLFQSPLVEKAVT